MKESAPPACAVGIDTVTLSGSLETKLEAACAAGFSQVMVSSRDLVGYSGGVSLAARCVRASGLRVTGFQVLRDFEGLAGKARAHKQAIAAAMLEMCAEVGAPVLLACSSTLPLAGDDIEAMAADLRRLAAMAEPLGIRVAYEALSWGRRISEFSAAWELVYRADAANLGLCIDSFHSLATCCAMEELDFIDPARIFLVQLADFLRCELRTREERLNTARHQRVYPGEGAHGAQIVALVRQLHRLGYRGDYSLEVFNDDYLQLRPSTVAGFARTSVDWLQERLLGAVQADEPQPEPCETSR